MSSAASFPQLRVRRKRPLQKVTSRPDDQVFPELRRGGPVVAKTLGCTNGAWTSTRSAVALPRSWLPQVCRSDVRNELLGREGTSVDEGIYKKGLPLEVLARCNRSR
jgi:hypothetical protein